jgi:hypothetical protein
LCESGFNLITGSDEKKIKSGVNFFLNKKSKFIDLEKDKNVFYGNGNAAQLIINKILK